MAAGSAGGLFARRQPRRSRIKARMDTPSHLCQLYSLSRWGENDRLTMYRPMPMAAIKASARNQCSSLAVAV
ncbi:hypothetical protein D3C78_1780880 [compost metagenome]